MRGVAGVRFPDDWETCVSPASVGGRHCISTNDYFLLKGRQTLAPFCCHKNQLAFAVQESSKFQVCFFANGLLEAKSHNVRRSYCSALLRRRRQYTGFSSNEQSPILSAFLEDQRACVSPVQNCPITEGVSTTARFSCLLIRPPCSPRPEVTSLLAGLALGLCSENKKVPTTMNKQEISIEAERSLSHHK